MAKQTLYEFGVCQNCHNRTFFVYGQLSNGNFGLFCPCGCEDIHEKIEFDVPIEYIN